ncbi:MAG: M23 family metallopeptidase [Eubacteriales bacterium]|nr:M23 family metallopeptidase [Eubacteriales bacterium]
MNIKNIKDKITKKINKQSIKGFFQKQGLYVLIFLCVVAAGITAIIAWPSPSTDEEQLSDSDTGAAVIEAPTLEEELAASETASATVTPTATDEPEEEAPTDNQETVAANNGSGQVTLKKPVDGQIINEFSGDALVYFASLNIWATHNGVDIQTENGAPVVAALSGTVTDVYTNAADGGVVVITHSSTAKTVYAGLGDIVVEEGDKVNTGDEIAAVGEMPKELDLSYHLHFEYIVDGIWKDPTKYFG